MERELEMVIRIPKERVKDFRVFIVLNGGEIKSETKVEEQPCDNKKED